MKVLPYIEDYIDLLGCGGSFVWPPRESIIKLARYDVNIVESMSDQIAKNIGFTDRQAALAHKIVIKYRRQWQNAGYDVSHHVETPKYKLPIRQIDRRSLIDYKNGKLIIRFPYDQNIIGILRSSIADVPGKLSWDPNDHYWSCKAIEPRIIWAKELGAANNFEFSTEFNELLEHVLQTPDYGIVLCQNQDGFYIENAEQSLLDYIQQRTGFSDIIPLLDLSSILNYTIDKDLNSYLDDYELNIRELLTKHTNYFTYKKEIDSFNDVLEYAKLSNRWPIYVYESGSTVLLNEIRKHFTENEILKNGHHLLNPEQHLKYPIVYFTHWKSINNTMPLLVTIHTMLIGHSRQQVASNAEKIVYYTQIPDNDPSHFTD